MRILIIGINYFPELTGCGPYTTDLANKLAKKGHDVYVICGFPHYPSWKVANNYLGRWHVNEFIDGVKIERVRHWVPKKYNYFGRIMYEITFGIHATIASFKYKSDICITITPSLLSILPGLVSKKRGSVLKILIQDLIAASTKSNLNNIPKLIQKITEWIEKKLLIKADSIGIISKDFEKVLLDYDVPSEKIHLTENYLLLKASNLTFDESRKKWGWGIDEKIVLYTGSIGNKQDLKNLVYAAQILSKERCKVKFVIVGEGPKKSELISIAASLPNIEFKDLVSEEDYPNLLNGADLLVVHEGKVEQSSSFPSKLINYIGSTRPLLIVANAKSALYEFAIANEIEKCIEGNPNLLSEKITELLQRDSEVLNEYPDLLKLPHIRLSWAQG